MPTILLRRRVRNQQVRRLKKGLNALGIEQKAYPADNDLGLDSADTIEEYVYEDDPQGLARSWRPW
jgi:hypothetical protein